MSDIDRGLIREYEFSPMHLCLSNYDTNVSGTGYKLHKFVFGMHTS